MTVFYTLDEAVASLTRLTRARLTTLIEVEAVRPTQTAQGPSLAEADLARLDLLCEMTEVYDLDADALAVFASLLDQLHAARADLRALADAVAAEPREVRTRIAARLIETTA
jgi:chaperone modulatory protein CbpM